jgi:hypothetical protein
MPRQPKTQNPVQGGRRLSVTLTTDQLQGVEALAKKNHASVAWVIREAIDRLLREDAPLFHLRHT